MLRTDDVGRCDLCGSEAGERLQRVTDGAWLCAACIDAWWRTQVPYGCTVCGSINHQAGSTLCRCPECGLRWSYHERRYDCDNAQDRYEAQQDYMGSL